MTILTLAVLLSVATSGVVVYAEPGTEEVISTEIEESVVEVVDDTTKEELEEALEQNAYLSNSYNQLKEKYQREKEFSRSVIYTLIFVIAILLVVIINMIVFYRRKTDEDFEDSFEEKKPQAKPSPKKEQKPEAKPEVKPVVKSVVSESDAGNNFEVFDFNDED